MGERGGGRVGMLAQLREQERPCRRLAGLCGQALAHKSVSGFHAPTLAQVRANPMKAMSTVLALCKRGSVPNGFC